MDIRRIIRESIQEAIKASDAYTEDDALDSVLSGKRGAGFLMNYTIEDKDNIKKIKDRGAKIMTVPRDGHGVYGDAYIVYTDERKAKQLKAVTEKHNGYLADNTPEEAIENGLALSYKYDDVIAFVKKRYGQKAFEHFSKPDIKKNMLDKFN